MGTAAGSGQEHSLQVRPATKKLRVRQVFKDPFLAPAVFHLHQEGEDTGRIPPMYVHIIHSYTRLYTVEGRRIW
jgi:hypothetical protein